MSMAFREYVCISAVGDAAACLRARNDVIATIREWNRVRQRAGTLTRIMLTPGDLEDEVYDPDILRGIEALVAARYPFLWLNITYNPSSLSEMELEACEVAHGLVVVADASLERSVWKE